MNTQVSDANQNFFLGECDSIRHLLSRVPAIVKARRTTLISGATGCGKEVLATTLHHRAYGANAPYMPVHCGALPEQLVEAELFGHTKGAFTGANQARPGLIKSASKGTLFLDEIDSLNLAMQSKLLRFLESGEYRAVGSDRIEHGNVWILAATNCDLRKKVKEGAFREDLLYRLNVIHLKIPSLQFRDGDVELLARYFLGRIGGNEYRFTSKAIQSLYTHDWPGNVRELKHRIERAVVLAESPIIDADDLELDSAHAQVNKESSQNDFHLSRLWKMIERDEMTLSEAISLCERSLINAALQAEHGNRTRAAKRLGIHVRTIFKKLNH